MNHFLKAVTGILAGTFISLSALSFPVMAQIAQPNGSYADEQAMIAQLVKSRSVQDQRKLAELLRTGLMAGADNPLRLSDRDGAIAAYRRAIELGDRSAGTAVALARLLLRENEAEGMTSLRPMLTNLVLQGNGDAAYVLALDAAQNRKLSNEEVTQKLEAAAVMGSIPAVIDLVESGALNDGPAKEASFAALEKRALSGWGPASYALYRAYDDGRLIARSPQQAMQWLTLAVDQGHLAAVEKLAEQFLLGSDAHRDAARAASLYRSAAEAGSAVSALALGRSSTGNPDMQISADEARIWLSRAVAIDFKDAAMELTNFDLAVAMRSTAAPEEKARMIAAALLPIADNPDALASLANKYWKTSNSSMIGPALLTLLKEHALRQNPAAGLAFNAWLQANGEALPEDVARALVEGLKKQPVRSAAFSSFLKADLALDGRLPETVLPITEALRLLTEAADAKVGQAMLRLGHLYQQGDVLAPNRTFAKRWLEQAKAQAVEQAAWDLAALQTSDDDAEERQEGERFYLRRLDGGDMRAGLALASYHLGTGDIDDLTLAQIRRAARQPIDTVELATLLIASGREKNVEAARQMLDLVSEGPTDVETDVTLSRLLILIASSDAEVERGLQRLEKAAEGGAQSARITLASTYLSSVSYRDRQAQAINLLHQVLAENPRNHDARLLMSKAYLMGLGIKRDAAKASALIEGIRAEGEYRNPKATMLAADWLAFSASDRDPEGAETLLKAQAARGSIAADRALGEFYLGGFAPMLEPDAAAARLYRAANAGDKEAMTSLGHLLINGYGVSKSQDEGMRWLKRAAEAGNTAAMYELSRIFALGPTGQIVGDQVIYWLTRAASRNHPNASYQLGLAYLKGEWVTADPQQSLAWFERSAAAGNLLAARTVDTIRAQISQGTSADISAVSHE